MGNKEYIDLREKYKKEVLDEYTRIFNKIELLNEIWDRTGNLEDATKELQRIEEEALKKTSRTEGDVLKEAGKTEGDVLKETGKTEGDVLKETGKTEEDALKDSRKQKRNKAFLSRLLQSLLFWR